MTKTGQQWLMDEAPSRGDRDATLMFWRGRNIKSLDVDELHGVIDFLVRENMELKRNRDKMRPYIDYKAYLLGRR